METQPISKNRKIASWVLVGIVSALLVMGAMMKITMKADSEMAKGAVKMGLEGKMMFIGMTELIITILFLIPKTSSIGVLLLSAYLGGAIATHVEHGDMFTAPAVVLTLAWVANYLRNPEMLESLKKK